MTPLETTIAGRRVFVTGHTGFTGSWLASWLKALGCSVYGFSLPPETDPSLFELLGGGGRFEGSTFGNICDHAALSAAMAAARPSLVFHLAAQPLVRRSYRDPLETFASNVLGTASVLEAARTTPGIEALVCITTDKVYDNKEWAYPYREHDRLGGKDPYSASKACAELVLQCYDQTMADLGNGIRLASARGGNIIGGGDWSEDRLVPDYVRAVGGGSDLVIRSPGAIRPWQHVLSACHGYLAIAHDLLTRPAGSARGLAWNIGPADSASLTVREVLTLLAETMPAPRIVYEPSGLKEAQILKLDTSWARTELGFSPPWTTRETIRRTGEWYAAFLADPASARAITDRQLADYRASLPKPN